jgi:hypothetical protein
MELQFRTAKRPCTAALSAIRAPSRSCTAETTPTTSISRYDLWFTKFDTFHTNLDTPAAAEQTDQPTAPVSGSDRTADNTQLGIGIGIGIPSFIVAVVGVYYVAWQVSSIRPSRSNDDRGVGSRVEIDQPE